MILTIHPDDRPWHDDAKSAELGIADWPRARHELRAVFSDHRIIATLGDMDVVGAPGAEHMVPAVYERLSSFVHDLGNSIPDCWMGAKHAIQNLAAMQHEPKHNALRNTFNGTVLCIASGPSNAKWLDKVRALQNQCVIVIADSMWKGCREAGIDPHFVCVLERDPLLFSLVPPDSSSRAKLVLPATSFPPTHEGWAGRRIWWLQQYTDLYRWIAPGQRQDPTGRSAGTMAAALSILLGAQKVYLIGHDLCRGDDGSSHAPSADILASSNHTKASVKREPLHDDLIIDGKRTCKFWDLARGDLETLNRDNPGIMLRLGDDGLDIPGVPRRQSITVAGMMTPGPFDKLPVEVSRDPFDMKAYVTNDKWHWQENAEFIAKNINSLEQYMIDGIQGMVHPKAWATHHLVDLYKYVLGPAYRAASLRAHLRAGTPDAAASAFRILMRAIPHTLELMEREL